AAVAVLGADRVAAAGEDDWAQEFLALKLAVGVVPSLDAAVDHIARYGTGHSEAIVTRDLATADRFTREVDAAAVLVNASTRFVDGEEFGFGAEIGISTQKLHARGPAGGRSSPSGCPTSQPTSPSPARSWTHTGAPGGPGSWCRTAIPRACR